MSKKEEILALKKEGLSYAEIGRQVSCSRQYVEQVCNPEKKIKRRNKYYSENREAILEKGRKYYAEHKEYFEKYRKNYNKKHPSYRKENTRKETSDNA